MKRATLATLAAAALVTALPLASAARAQTGFVPETARITVQGEGEVTAVPDMATVSLGVLAEDAEAATAMREIGERTAAVLARIETAGIAAEDVQTSSLDLSPRWSERSSIDGAPPKIETFVASTQLQVRVRDLDRLGALIDAAVQDGANRLDGLSFGLQEPQPLEDATRQAAVADAIRKASLLAEAAGARLGPILRIDEAGGVRPLQMRGEVARFAAASAMPVAAGEMSVAAQVSITWELLPGDG